MATLMRSANTLNRGVLLKSTLQSPQPGTVLWGRICFVVLALVTWQWVATATSMAKTISTPLDTLTALAALLIRADVWWDIWLLVQSAVIGLVICTIVGVLAGLLLSLSNGLYLSASFVIDFLRTVPGLAVIPLGILVLGPTLKLDLMMITLSAIWPILLQTIYAVRQMDRETMDTAKAYKIPAWRRMVFILLPACSPRIATGIRIAATMSLLLAIGTQLIAGSPGLGNRISVYQQSSGYAEMFACIIIAGLLGILINASLKLIEAKSLRWHFLPRRLAARTGA